MSHIIEDYYNWVSEELKTNKNSDDIVDIFNYSSGLTEECGEFMKIINRGSLHEEVDMIKFVEEMGDFLWYMVAIHCLIHNDYDKFRESLNIILHTSPKYMEVNALMCDTTKLQGLYRKKIFFAREISDDLINTVYGRCSMRFVHIAHYFGLSMADIATDNMNKLKVRYPNGRSSKYFIELNFRIK